MGEMAEMANTQTAPYPAALLSLVSRVAVAGRDWVFWLGSMQRDDPAMGRGASSGLTLTITITTEDTRNPARKARVMFLFPVPPATYDMRSWRRWLFDRCRDVDLHELMEAFTIGGEVPYAPSHGPGNDPYMIREVGTAADTEWAYNQPRPSDGDGDSG
jgi:hypothetical protein